MSLPECKSPAPALEDWPPPTALIFEPAGVLYDATPGRRWLWHLVLRLGLRTTYEDFIRPWDAEFLPPVLRGERPYSAALHDFLASLGLSAADQIEIAAAMPHCSQPLDAGVRPLPGVRRALARLASLRFSLAVLSDSSLPGCELKEHLDGLGLGNYFGPALTSTDLGTTKPQPHNYLAIAAAAGAAPRQCLYLSTRRSDLLGARTSGLRTVAVEVTPSGTADFSISSLGQLADLLRTCRGESLRAAA